MAGFRPCFLSITQVEGSLDPRYLRTIGSAVAMVTNTNSPICTAVVPAGFGANVTLLMLYS